MADEKQKVIDELSEKLNWAMQSIETISSLTQLQENAITDQNTNRILQESTRHIQHLIQLEASAFFIVDENTGEFLQQECQPAMLDERMHREKQASIQNGTFGWANSNNHAVITDSTKADESLVLHTIATRNKTYGLFIGIFNKKQRTVSSISFDILSIIAVNTAMAIESYNNYFLIHRYNEQLERDIKERTRDLEVSQKRAESASIAKSAFLANMSHTLKTPLNAIIGYSEMLLEDARDEGKLSMAEDLERIFHSGKILLTTIVDMLDYSKMEAGHIIFENTEFVIEEMLTSLMFEAKDTAKTRNNIVKFETHLESGKMLSDPTRIKQALSQLVSNANKFTENGNITITARDFISEDKRYVEFIISDTGIGIAPDTVDNLFSAFTQLDESSSKQYEGTGLGLAIVRFIVNKLEGEIRVESEVDKGSQFFLTLPDPEKQTPSPNKTS